ncbi:MAG: M15 family metallopeptidase [Mycoplasmatales bacterium]
MSKWFQNNKFFSIIGLVIVIIITTIIIVNLNNKKTSDLKQGKELETEHQTELEYKQANNQTEETNKQKYTAPAAYTEVKESTCPSSTSVLVNKQYSLPSNYRPASIVYPDLPVSSFSSNSVHTVSEVIVPALTELFAGAEQAGYPLVVYSGFRPYEMQTSLYNSYVASEGQVNADRFSARPGFSEHQTGITLDVMTKELDSVELEDMTGTPAAKWLEDNSYKFGFIIRYASDKEDVTLYKHEAWHLRYVGVEQATQMYNEHLSLEEYYFKYPAKMCS